MAANAACGYGERFAVGDFRSVSLLGALAKAVVPASQQRWTILIKLRPISQGQK